MAKANIVDYLFRKIKYDLFICNKKHSVRVTVFSSIRLYHTKYRNDTKTNPLLNMSLRVMH